MKEVEGMKGVVEEDGKEDSVEESNDSRV